MTLSALAVTEPYKTDKTDIVSNNDFIHTVMGALPPDIRPIVTSFVGNPETVVKRDWFGTGWTQADRELPTQHNNYFSLASYTPHPLGGYRRKKECFHALHAVMLDDIGTKVDRDRVTLQPSWMLETSQGNYQAGYILKTPLQDAAQADRLMKAIIEAGLCDAGAGGPTARNARLPVAINGKRTPVFECHLDTWQPDLRYSVDEIINGLNLDMRPKQRPKVKAMGKAQPHDAGDEIYIPRPHENAVIATLKSKGLYKYPLGQGKHDITCPWVQEHTGAVDGGTAYFEPDDNYPIGGFKCMHGHCAQRRVRDLLQYLCIEVEAARMKPTIRVIAGELHRIADKAENELAQTGQHYQRGGLIVTISTEPSTRETCVKDLKQNALIGALSCAAQWERYDKRSESWSKIDPPPRVVSVLYDASDYRHLPVLNGLTHQPYLRPDGTLVRNSGYDVATGLFGVFGDMRFHIPETPSRQNALDALALISGLLSEFSFASDHDKAAALSAILTAVVRPSLPLAPMYHVRAPQISSGKSFLCQIIAAFASPRRNAPTGFPKDEEECQKLLLSELLRAPAVIEFDNLTSDLVAHKSLCTALTSEFLTGRILGVSKTATVTTRALFLSSGNNVGPVNDMTRRCVTINLDPACENPASRRFKNPNVLGDLLKEREKYVSAALTIIRAWIAAGQPQTPCKSLASYQEWAELCRQPLLWLGLSDPTESVFKVMDEDPDRETLGRLMQAWKYQFGTTPKMVRDAVAKANDSVGFNSSNKELYEILTDIAADRQGINRRILGHWIKRHAHRIVDGMRFVPVGGSRSASAWRVESVS